MKFAMGVFLLVLISGFSGCQGKGEAGQAEIRSSGETVTVFAAASTSSVFYLAAEKFEESTSYTVEVNPASSGTLARQLEMGAEADLYISASTKWIQYVDEQGLIEERTALFQNTLVLIAPGGSAGAGRFSDEMDLQGLLTSSSLAIGDPDHVPAGRYAREFLENAGLYSIIEEDLIKAINVSSVLHLVELAEADLGLVYRTDALLSEKVKIIYTVPEKEHSPILYHCAFLKGGSVAGYELFRFLLTDPQALKTFEESGFMLLDTQPLDN